MELVILNGRVRHLTDQTGIKSKEFTQSLNSYTNTVGTLHAMSLQYSTESLSLHFNRAGTLHATSLQHYRDNQLFELIKFSQCNSVLLCVLCDSSLKLPLE